MSEPPVLDFSINDGLEIHVEHMGNERRPVVIVDNLLRHPQSILDFAGRRGGFAEDRSDFYPGIRKSLPDDYATAIATLVGTALREGLAIEGAFEPKAILCALSIVTSKPASLAPIQCIPHIDTSRSDQIAAVHYLCDPHHGGTSFYRHRETGFEAIDESRNHEYRKTLERQATTIGLPARQYISGDTTLFERIATIDAKFNRAIFYCSNLLHAGDINVRSGLPADPITGRLTATCFVRLLRQS
ncbi:hypothetical protein MNBD_ALPHA05-122 [hydrothermal vent metagenome]|uniref:Uncharacterized protein n=1 Tax=hydrothermal vent metagenome TaxID=652676 RepID=A0A3B0SPI1_9ZZZZ